MPRIIYLLTFLSCSIAVARDARPQETSVNPGINDSFRDPDVAGVRRPLRGGEPGGVRPSS